MQCYSSQNIIKYLRSPIRHIILLPPAPFSQRNLNLLLLLSPVIYSVLFVIYNIILYLFCAYLSNKAYYTNNVNIFVLMPYLYELFIVFAWVI